MFQNHQGLFTTQGHKGIPKNHFEEEQGRKGFFGPVSHLIKPQPSTRWTHIEGPLRPQLFDLVKMPQKPEAWQRILFNSDVALYNFWTTPQTAQTNLAVRNADGETLYFCHQGGGSILTDYGLLTYEKGSYILIPKCVMHTIIPADVSQFIIIESKSGMYREPERGMVGRNAFYDPAAFGVPRLEEGKALLQKQHLKVTQVSVKRLDQITNFTYNDCVYDTVGWKGDFFPVTLHVRDLMPLLSARVHLPPSAHTTFAANGFVVCTFLPRPLESDADALKVPFYHQNIDYDEVLFYHDGNFFSRDNLHAGMMTLHPAGFPHGPHPKAVHAIDQKTHTDEYAVMIDTWNPLMVESSLSNVEVPEYWKSWMK